ncbi:MAG: diacylglycerol/lipid kinase family protein [Anaerolineae bacterium]
MAKKDKVRYAKLIANPGAGKGTEINTKVKLAVRCLEQLGIQTDVALAKPKEEATPIAEKAAEDGYNIVIAMGGDGTIEAVMRGLVGTKTRLGILPFGTENNVAKSLGIPEDIEAACKLIADAETRKLDIGQVKVKNGPKMYFWELTVVGLVAALFPEGKKILKGELSKLKDAADTLLAHETKSKIFMKMDDDSRVEVETMLVVVSNTPMFGKNFLVAPTASLEDGLLDILVYPDFSKAELIAYFAAIMDEGYSENEKVQHYRARKLEIKTKPPLEANADAVDLGKGNMKIRCLPGALRVIAPAPSSPKAFAQEPSNVVPAPLAPPTPKEEEAEPVLADQKEK